MQFFTKVVIWFAILHIFALTVVYVSSGRHELHSYKTDKIQGLLYTEETLKYNMSRFSPREISFSNLSVFNGINLLKELGAYAEIGIEYFNLSGKEMMYNVTNFQLKHDADYCPEVDLYNFEHLDNMFEQQNLFTDFTKGKVRTEVINQIGTVPMKKINSKYIDAKKRKYHLDQSITNFFMNFTDFHFHHEIGKDFLCVTQMYNHIPGHESLTRKDLNLDIYRSYIAQYNDKQECIDNELAAIPKFYRLNIKEECEEFFTVVNSEEYQLNIETTPVQFIIKAGLDSHGSQGVELFTPEMRSTFNELYEAGKNCGYWTKPLIAQSYISNPLLLNMGNKFDFKAYMLVASTNPLIVYYHDGFLTATLSEYDKTSLAKSMHITSTEALQDIMDHLVSIRSEMTAEDLKEYHLWTFQDLEDMLYDNRKIEAKDWLGNHLRPELQKAMAHLARMSKGALWKESNVYQLFEVDFMLDENMKLWYIETNASPQFRQDTKKMSSLTVNMLKDMFDVQYAYYRGRMKRLTNLVALIEKEMNDKGSVDFSKWQEEYKKAVQNKLEPEYPIREDNKFSIVVDENLKGTEAYFGRLDSKCI